MNSFPGEQNTSARTACRLPLCDLMMMVRVPGVGGREICAVLWAASKGKGGWGYGVTGNHAVDAELFPRAPQTPS